MDQMCEGFWLWFSNREGYAIMELWGKWRISCGRSDNFETEAVACGTELECEREEWRENGGI